MISRDEVCARYMMSAEELVAWERAYDENGVPGLRTTRLQSYRSVRILDTQGQQQPEAAQQLR
jgi:hypothetical protein